MPSRPDWTKWRHVPEVTLIEGVALSLNIDPSEFDFIDHRGMVHAYSALVSAENRLEHEKRLFIAKRNSGVNRALKPTGNTELSGSIQVLLPQFAAWVCSMKWSIPQELVEIARDSATDLKHIGPTDIGDSKTSRPKGYLDHDPEWQQRANKIAAKKKRETGKAVTRNTVARLLADELREGEETVKRRIRKQW